MTPQRLCSILTGLLTLLVAGVLASCAGISAEAQNTPTPFPEGARLYRERCGNCHDLYPPYSYPNQQWPRVVSSMQGLAQLTNEEREQILEWIRSENQ